MSFFHCWCSKIFARGFKGTNLCVFLWFDCKRFGHVCHCLPPVLSHLLRLLIDFQGREGWTHFFSFSFFRSFCVMNPAVSLKSTGATSEKIPAPSLVYFFGNQKSFLHLPWCTGHFRRSCPAANVERWRRVPISKRMPNLIFIFSGKPLLDSWFSKSFPKFIPFAGNKWIRWVVIS